jgi:hypothetical protein
VFKIVAEIKCCTSGFLVSHLCGSVFLGTYGTVTFICAPKDRNKTRSGERQGGCNVKTLESKSSESTVMEVIDGNLKFSTITE